MLIEANAFDFVERGGNYGPPVELPDNLLSDTPQAVFEYLISGDVPAGKRNAALFAMPNGWPKVQPA
ncbi:MAG: hypothetical protein ACTHJQ_01965 [Rhizobiaceae bacterium]